MAEVTITPRDHGPYLVRGSLRLVDADGREWSVDREVVALCRCGGSANKPFCDGTHARIGFQSQCRARRLKRVRASELSRRRRLGFGLVPRGVVCRKSGSAG